MNPNPLSWTPRLLLPVLLIFAPGSFSAASAADDKPLKVFICAGQSNMAGKRSLLRDTPEGLKAAQDNLFFEPATSTWIPLAPGVTEDKGFGPEITFAQDISKAIGEPVGIIKHSQGGSDLVVLWNPTRRNGKATVPGPLYKTLVEKVALAAKTRPIEVIGMIWMQGEQDAKSGENSDKYRENLKSLITAARNDFRNPDMVFIAGRITFMDDRFPWVESVRKAQESCDLPAYAWIDCDQLPKGSDGIHYSTDGILQMGVKFSEAMQKLLNAPAPGA